jgi:hypothetical protein
MYPIFKLAAAVVLLVVGNECLGNSRLFLAGYSLVAIAILFLIRCPGCRAPVVIAWKWWQGNPGKNCSRCGYDLLARPISK